MGTKERPRQVSDRALPLVNGQLTARGDRALADMVLAHSLTMNGGVLHAVESLNSEELARTVGIAAGDDTAIDALEASADTR